MKYVEMIYSYLDTFRKLLPSNKRKNVEFPPISIRRPNKPSFSEKNVKGSFLLKHEKINIFFNELKRDRTFLQMRLKLGIKYFCFFILTK